MEIKNSKLAYRLYFSVVSSRAGLMMRLRNTADSLFWTSTILMLKHPNRLYPRILMSIAVGYLRVVTDLRRSSRSRIQRGIGTTSVRSELLQQRVRSRVRRVWDK